MRLLDSERRLPRSEMARMNTGSRPTNSEAGFPKTESGLLNPEMRWLDSERHLLNSEMAWMNAESRPTNSETGFLKAERGLLESESGSTRAEGSPRESVGSFPNIEASSACPAR